MIVVGIDPGKSGAIAWWDSISGWSVEDCPTMDAVVAGKSRKVSSPSAMADIVRNILQIDRMTHVFLEKIWAGGGSGRQQGGISMFTFGENFGIWKGVLASHRIPCQLVTAQKWKRHFCIPKGKAASLQVARSMFPSMAIHLQLSSDHNVADALLIAEYGKQTMGLK